MLTGEGARASSVPNSVVVAIDPNLCIDEADKWQVGIILSVMNVK